MSELNNRMSEYDRHEARRIVKQQVTNYNYGQAQAKMLPTMQFRYYGGPSKWPNYEKPKLQQKFIETTADGGVEHWLNIPTVTDEAAR